MKYFQKIKKVTKKRFGVYTKENDQIVENMDMVNENLKMENTMRGVLKKTLNKEQESQIFQKKKSILVNFKEVRRMAEGFVNFRVKIYSQDNIQMEQYRDLEQLITKRKEFMKENEQIRKNKDMDAIYLEMGIDMKDNSTRIKDKEKELMFITMEIYMKENE